MVSPRSDDDVVGVGPQPLHEHAPQDGAPRAPSAPQRTAVPVQLLQDHEQHQQQLRPQPPNNPRHPAPQDSLLRSSPPPASSPATAAPPIGADANANGDGDAEEAAAPPRPKPSAAVRELSKGHALERRLADAEARTEEVFALKAQLREREREVFAFAAVVDNLRTTLDDGQKAVCEASALRQIVHALVKRAEGNGDEVAQLQRQSKQLELTSTAKLRELEDQLRREVDHVAQLKHVIERQRQVSAEREKALELKCDVLKSTNRLLSYAPLLASLSLSLFKITSS
jgi:hypothetical protein